jgi:NTP pyrophosphatase (non-canonical NTP hydrolase)
MIGENMTDIMKAVYDFHVKFGVNRNDDLLISRETAPIYTKRVELIEEEIKEFFDALEDFSRLIIDKAKANGGLYKIDYDDPLVAEHAKHLAKECADVVYTIAGLMDLFRINLTVAIDQVCESNMTKEPSTDGISKIQKGKDYKAPELDGCLPKQE